MEINQLGIDKLLSSLEFGDEERRLMSIAGSLGRCQLRGINTGTERAKKIVKDFFAASVTSPVEPAAAPQAQIDAIREFLQDENSWIFNPEGIATRLLIALKSKGFILTQATLPAPAALPLQLVGGAGTSGWISVKDAAPKSEVQKQIGGGFTIINRLLGMISPYHAEPIYGYYNAVDGDFLDMQLDYAPGITHYCYVSPLPTAPNGN